MTDERNLNGKIALVAGATRGAGRAIAVELGRLGATVYVTGRTTRARSSEVGRAETIEDTADLVTAAGGTGIAVPTDHLDPAQVRALAARVDADHGRLDVLVNDIWGGEHLLDIAAFGKPMWEQDLDKGLRMLQLSVNTHLITGHGLLELLTRNPGGLHVEITDGTEAGSKEYREHFFYDLAKVIPIRVAWALGHELEKFGGTAMSMTPGFLRSEQMLDGFGVTEETWHDAIPKQEHWGMSETPHYLGRCLAAVAADPDRHRFNKQSRASWELAREYGIDDVDGSRPHWDDYFADFKKTGVSDYDAHR
ncbi:short-chain dehydrogenase [Actinorhabdospora filicis]|uniref:Short-chain dehydrogenase n=1 Tax=Actinorhabdospora filicis TaxID=1785913 RepID=A0A9W6SGY0_9ACTN|nr:SDR family oxidoreductase [Actinorhabdospora filicis]GLZ76083.1 short-chain dehydrogenase [Actinorhabdospora filicis]